jgi:hypothetical protein
VLVNKNQNTLENLVSKKLQARGTVLPARKSGAFTASTLTYHTDNATLTDYIRLDDVKNMVVQLREIAPPVAVPRRNIVALESIEAIPFASMEEPPSTKNVLR